MNAPKQTMTSIVPRGLSRIEASAYIGVSASLFDEMVDDHRMPPPKRANSRRIWDIRQLDEAFDSLPSAGTECGDPFEAITLIKK